MWEEVTVWSWIGLAFMAMSAIVMVSCVVWMITW